MIPIKLTIEGLYSYQKRQTIDFEKLTSSHLFGIFGQVGSGKSSILEAISFAIYGDTERLNKNESRGYNMMNLKSDRMLIEFEFASGTDQKHYLATASARRNSKRFDDVKTIERKAYVGDSSNWQPIELGELEKAIGLSYSNFKRTIIIPQGKFQEFLQLDKKERTNMMKELFGLEKYDLYRKVSAIDKRNNERRQYLEGQAASLGNVDDVLLEQLQASLAQHQAVAAQLRTELEAKRKELEQHTRLFELEDKKQRIASEKIRLESQSEAIGELERQLTEYELYIQIFKPITEQKAHLKESIQSLNTSIASTKFAMQTVQKELAAKQETQNALKSDYEKRTVLQEEVADQLLIATIKELDAESQAFNSRIEKGDIVIKETEEASKTIANDIEKKKQELKECKAKTPNPVKISKAKEWFAVQKGLHEQLEQLGQECKKAETAKQATNDKLAGIAHNDLLTAREVQINADALRQTLAEISQETDKATASADAEIQHLSIQQELNKYKTSLAEGTPCPLCGATHHPKVGTEVNVIDDLKRQQALRASLDKQQNDCRQLMHTIDLIAQEQTAADARLQELNDKRSKVSTTQLEHQKAFEWDEYKTEQALNEALSTVEMLSKQAKAIDDELEKLANALDAKNKDVEKFRLAVTDFKMQRSEIAGKIKSAEDSLKHLKTSSFSETAAETLRQSANERKVKLDALIKRFEELTAAIADLRQAEGKHSGTLAANEALLAKEEQQLANLNDSLNAKMQEYDETSEAHIIDVLNAQLNIAQTKQTISDYRQKVQTAKAQLQDVEKELNGKTYDQQLHDAAKSEMSRVNEQSQSNNTEIGRIDNELTTKRKQKEQFESIKKDLDSVIERASILSTLKTLLQGNRFIDYASTTYLRNLCMAANERFYKMTRQRLQLELTDDNNFQVRDFMNGGKTRNVKTLSGGQTFQASLSLALALSDNIQKIQQSRQNFFFLDEGFGTLDKDSLSIVFDTLKTLRNENRIVGVISHVDEMQQEIETYLSVTNNEEQGSMIKCSWI